MSQAAWIMHKDLLIEWRARARPFALACFALTVLLLFAFAVGPSSVVIGQHASAYLWLAVLMSSTLLFGRSFQLEIESNALDAMALAPVSPSALQEEEEAGNNLPFPILSLKNNTSNSLKF